MIEYTPKTLQEAILFFSDQDRCLAHMVALRWPNGVTCPTCGSEDISFIKSRRVWQCKTRHAKCQFSIKVGTIFEDSAIGLDKWLVAMWMLTNCKNGVSSCEIHRALGVTQKTAWFMLHRIRLMMHDGAGGKLGGGSREIEADETFVGGKVFNMHKGKRKAHGTGGMGKAMVLGLLERGGKVKTKVIENTRTETLRNEIQEHVEPGCNLYTDALHSYRAVDAGLIHEFIDHAVSYAKGKVHTNCLENFWSLLKRGLKGTYVSVEPFHLFRYLDEQAFRYNNRKDMNDSQRFNAAAKGFAGKRLTYKQLTGQFPDLRRAAD